MAKFKKAGSAVEEFAVEEAAPTPALVIVPNIKDCRCGGCFFFVDKCDSNNPSDGHCHAAPPVNKSMGFEWTRTASNQIGCGQFKKRG